MISVCAAGFALVLTSLKNATRVLLDNLSSDGIDIELPIILEEKRLERQARAAEKRFNDGDTTAAEYRAAIAQIETRRWQLRMAAAWDHATASYVLRRRSRRGHRHSGGAGQARRYCVWRHALVIMLSVRISSRDNTGDLADTSFPRLARIHRASRVLDSAQC